MKYLLVIACCALTAIKSSAQLNRPTALATYQKCRGLTCIWTSDSTAHTKTGPYEAFLAESNTMADPESDFPPTDLVVMSDDTEVARIFLKSLSASVTLTWSPTYKAFAVSWSDGGSIGNFHTEVFELTGDHFERTNSVDRGFAHFKARHDCATRGDNVQAYRFENHGSELMLILSVYPTGDCGLELGHTEGYLVRVSDGAIIRCLGIHELNAYMRLHPEGS